VTNNFGQLNSKMSRPSQECNPLGLEYTNISVTITTLVGEIQPLLTREVFLGPETLSRVSLQAHWEG